MIVKSESEVAQSCPTLSDPMDCSLPGSSIRGIFQARVLEWVAIDFSTTLLRLLIPACDSSILAFHMMYSAYKLNKQVMIYSLDVLLFLFGTSLLFHVHRPARTVGHSDRALRSVLAMAACGCQALGM